jgi:PKD repeat protein
LPADYPYHLEEMRRWAQARYNILITTLLNLGVSIPGFFRVDFSAQPRTGNAPLEVRFDNTSSGDDIVAYHWEFGDGATSDVEEPVHVYEVPGNYDVSLRAVRSDGTDATESKTGFVRVRDNLRAAFSGAPVEGFAPLEVAFRDESTGYRTSWEWEFGDGAVSTEQHPTHTYTAPGTYTVRLRVMGVSSSTAERLDYISVDERIVVDFSAEPRSGPAPLDVLFTNQTTGAGVLFATWDFGDGRTSAEPDPMHTYSVDGAYDVSLRVVTESQVIVETKRAFIQVGSLAGTFVRGDANGDGAVDLSDVVVTLGFIFRAALAPPCLDALDADDNGRLSSADAVRVLLHLFQGGPPPPAPYPGRGTDPTEDGMAGCEGAG